MTSSPEAVVVLQDVHDRPCGRSQQSVHGEQGAKASGPVMSSDAGVLDAEVLAAQGENVGTWSSSSWDSSEHSSCCCETSHVSVDKHSQSESTQRLQLLTVVQSLGGQLALHHVVPQQLPQIRRHRITSCDTNTLREQLVQDSQDLDQTWIWTHL